MKTFKQFLESEDDNHLVKAVATPDIKVIADKIRRECSIMVEAYSNCDRVLMRGIKEHRYKISPLVGHAHIRKDRRPIFMDQKYHDMLNAAFSDMHLPTRGNSLFVTTRQHIANAWGSESIVFVKDGWTGVIFEKIGPDQYAFDDLWQKVNQLEKSSSMSEAEKHEEIKQFIVNLQPFKFNTSDGLMKVLKQRYTDILIQGTEYYTLSLDPDQRVATKAVLAELGIFDLENVHEFDQ